MVAATTPRSLPGIRFEAHPPPPVAILPRMDIAAFVGFAASGPIDTPVAVEDPTQFAAIFGEDAQLFWDEREGEQVTALLAPAVRSFFRNGGRRCWVVRVAAPAAGVTRFPIPGLVHRRPDGFLRPATLVARSHGSWADSLRVGAAVAAEGLAARAAGTGAVELPATAGAGTGDMLRLAYRDGRLVLLAAVEAVEPHPDRHESVVARLGPPLWLRRRSAAVGEVGRARFVGADGRLRTVAATVVDGGADDRDAAVVLDLAVGLDGAPTTAVHLRVALPGAVLWLRVTDVRSTDEETTRATGVAAWPARGRWLAAPQEPPQRAERLTLELRVTRGEGELARLGGLGLAPGHPRYLGDLPTDVELYSGDCAPSTPPPPLWRAAAEPRFPLAAPPSRRETTYLPLAVPALAEDTLAPWLPPGAPLHRDGLDEVDASLFLDPGLREVATGRLSAEADHIRYGGAQPRRLRGIHSLLRLEEPTIVAVPEAAQRRWYRLPAAEPTRAVSPDQPSDPASTGFRDCARRLLATPELVGRGPDAAGRLMLAWTASDDDRAEYVVQEAADPRFADAYEVYRGAALSLDLYGRGRRVAYYRVRAEAAGNVSRWSGGVTAAAGARARWTRVEPTSRVDTQLAEVHAALLRLCAARGDMVALLSLPEHYRVDEIRAQVAELSSTRPGMLGAGEATALGFGALYHPWIVATTPERPLDFRTQPPDGAVAGVMANRALTRGAWVAAANEPLADVVTLRPTLAASALQPLQDLQVNTIRRVPDGFLWLASDTLSRDPDTRALNVRRLLNLLRRAALRNATPYVFEPNGNELERRVQRAFEGVLGRIADLGGFAGATQAEMFRVAVLPDEERLVVELRVAASLPLRFLVVRLVQRGDGAVVVEEL